MCTTSACCWVCERDVLGDELQSLCSICECNGRWSQAMCRVPLVRGHFGPSHKLQHGNCSEEGDDYGSSLPLWQSIPKQAFDPSIKGRGSVSSSLPTHPPAPSLACSHTANAGLATTLKCEFQTLPFSLTPSPVPDGRHREQQEHQAHETALFKAQRGGSHLQAKLSLWAISRWCSLPLLPAFCLANCISALILGGEPGSGAALSCVRLGSCTLMVRDAAALLCPMPQSL